jgi:hypothetical protein
MLNLIFNYPENTFQGPGAKTFSLNTLRVEPINILTLTIVPHSMTVKYIVFIDVF